eukprot:gb/GFBE01035621.1/.p1 GENE.gb/GFBE01035621.1/~~gb/GFBE01035621.1/.p1  ORF type:complete len:203 (+),score=33.93 gb/GFBE01035621.1/:3-611(+)
MHLSAVVLSLFALTALAVRPEDLPVEDTMAPASMLEQNSSSEWFRCHNYEWPKKGKTNNFQGVSIVRSKLDSKIFRNLNIFSGKCGAQACPAVKFMLGKTTYSIGQLETKATSLMLNDLKDAGGKAGTIRKMMVGLYACKFMGFERDAQTECAHTSSEEMAGHVDQVFRMALNGRSGGKPSNLPDYAVVCLQFLYELKARIK